jgi:hypothetical protein
MRNGQTKIRCVVLAVKDIFCKPAGIFWAVLRGGFCRGVLNCSAWRRDLCKGRAPLRGSVDSCRPPGCRGGAFGEIALLGLVAVF